MARLALSLLGPPHLTRNEERVRSFPYDKVVALLAFLVVEASRPQRRETLADLLWPDRDPRAARHSLSQALFCLRQFLENSADQPLVLLTRTSVQLAPAAEHWVDVVAFLDHLDRRRRHHPSRGLLCLQCATWLQQAVELYRGDFLAQLSLPDAPDFDDWVLQRRAAFLNQTLGAMDDLIDYHGRRGELDEAASYARRQLALDPLREESHRRLMSLLARRGERGAALAQYERCRQLLRDELGVEPDAATTGLYQRLRDRAEGSSEAAPAVARHQTRDKLPDSLMPFVGRQAELARLTEHLFAAKARLVTLVGPGGIGKTRLALQVAAPAVETFADGVAFVPLAGVPSGGRLLSAIGDAVSLQFRGPDPPREQLGRFLRERELLLVLDNFEHLLDDAVLIPWLLARAPRLQVMVTSRERLHLQAESVFEIDGLDVPPDDETENLQGYSAVELFTQSARRVRSSFDPDPSETRAVARMCRLVGGMPLAIELAAAWVPVLSCAEIAAEIGKGLDVLAAEIRDLPERHRSIRAVFDRSWQGLSPFDQDVFRQLSVFRGGFRREAAERMLGRALPSLAALVGKSLLRRNALGRYEMHELLRQYAEEQLERDPDAARHARDQHGAYYTGLLAQSAEALQDRRQEAALADLNAEIDNLRAAWSWETKRGNLQAIAGAAHGMWLFCEMGTRYVEGESAFAEAVRAVEATAVADRTAEPLRALSLGRLLARHGSFFFRLGGVDVAEALIDRAIGLLRALDAPGDLGLALNFRAMGARARQDYVREQQDLAESIELLARAGETWGLAYSTNDLALVRFVQGDSLGATRLCQHARALFDELGDKRGTAFALRNLGVISLGTDDFIAARRYLSECLAMRRALGNQWGIADALYQLGMAARSMGDADRALHELREALETAADGSSMTLALEVLTAIADLRARRGESAEAAAILAAITRHPASDPAVRDRARSLLNALSADWTAEPTEADAERLVRQEIRDVRPAAERR